MAPFCLRTGMKVDNRASANRHEEIPEASTTAPAGPPLSWVEVAATVTLEIRLLKVVGIICPFTNKTESASAVFRIQTERRDLVYVLSDRGLVSGSND